jgi:type II secretory pathway pseudopilin PulG
MNTNKTRGYTLLEAMVTVGVMGVMSSILLVGVVSARRSAMVRSAANEYAGKLREAATLAQNGVKNQACLDYANTLPEGDQKADIIRQCSEYAVTYSEAFPRAYKLRTYVYDASLSKFPGELQFTLPAEARFYPDAPETAGSRRYLFRYKPPLLKVYTAHSADANGFGASPMTGVQSVPIVHAADTSVRAYVCISGSGVVEVRSTDTCI